MVSGVRLAARPRRALQVVLAFILLIGFGPILLILNTDSSQHQYDSRLREGWMQHNRKPWETWEAPRWDAGGETGAIDAAQDEEWNVKNIPDHQDIQGNNRRLRTNHDRNVLGNPSIDQSMKLMDLRRVEPPVLKQTFGNYEPRDVLARTGPGEYGAGVYLDSTETHLYEQAYKEYGFNMVVSDRISLDRAVTDLRDTECKLWHYPTNLPNCSVIVVFHNEGWSTLIRTIHSIINTSPSELLAEVILVDDYSDKEHLKAKLEQYIGRPRFSGKVRIVRNTKREGLIRSRTVGATYAIGEVITFLDAHCECAPNWLPPLLSEIAIDRTTVVCPTVDAINAENFGYASQGDGLCRGAFDWDFWYKRIPVSLSWDRLGLKYKSQPYLSPVMAGGLFALDRSYFFELGGYDPGLQIWGGENFEISFKAWMCGGRLKFVPCSRVGHIYRKHVPYTYPDSGVDGVSVVHLNYMRVAEVWLDEYRDYFYATKPHLQGKSCGNISAQVEFRRKRCPKSFRWFMEEVAFDTLARFPPPAPNRIWGEIRSVDSELCLDTNGAQNNHLVTMGMEGCHGLGGNQLFRLNTKGHLVAQDEYCLHVKASAILQLKRCSMPTLPKGDDSVWVYDQNLHIIRIANQEICLDHDQQTNKIFASPCIAGKLSQQFKFYREGMQ